jgi:nucleoside phosphorylase
VQILLENGADVNAQGGKYGNALQAASSKGYEGIVQILLENGADVNAQGGKYGNALQAASYEGHEKVVQILLENGADVNTKGGEYGNALQAASQGDHENVVQMLLDRGAGVLTENGALDIQLTPDAFNKLGRLYSDQGKVKVAKMMYQRALEYGELYKDEHPGARFPKRKSVSVILAKDFSIGLICAIPVEFVAVRALLDETYELQLDLHNSNDYAYGRIGAHNVVISKGEYGTASAARVASEMVSIFSNLRIALLVGVGGGAPSRRHDIRLGDVVVSAPSSDIRLGDVVISAPSSGQVLVYQYDFGKTIQSREFQQAGSLMEPPGSLWAAVAGLRASYEMKQQILEETIEKALTLRPLLRKIYERPDLKSDRLFQSEVVHRYSKEPCDPGCCNKPSDLVSRKLRDAWEDNPAVHYGLIASGESPMNDALLRDKLAAEKGILCFETEAAGLMDDLPCLVIRGICDYSDSHRNKDWQGYAAMAAAAYARDILYRISPQNVKPQEIVAKIVN